MKIRVRSYYMFASDYLQFWAVCIVKMSILHESLWVHKTKQTNKKDFFYPSLSFLLDSRWHGPLLKPMLHYNSAGRCSYNWTIRSCSHHYCWQSAFWKSDEGPAGPLSHLWMNGHHFSQLVWERSCVMPNNYSICMDNGLTHVVIA